MTLLIVFESLVLAGWVCIVLYGFILCLMNWMTKRREAPLIWPRHVFAVLIPTENAEAIIGQTLERLLKVIEYPRGMFDLIVVPVNCTDRTTTIARQKSAIVYGPGKRRWRDRNEAIQSVLERLFTKRRYDASVILDITADVSPNFLAVLSDKLSKGAQIIQSGYRFAGPVTSWRAGVTSVVYAISPSLFILWTNRFRFTTGLHRIGVCLSRGVVEKYGVRSPAITDGIPYVTRLLLDDVAVDFAPKAIVYDHKQAQPPTHPFGQQVATWWRLIRRHAFQLIRDGIRWRSAAQITGGVHLLIPPLSLIFGGAVLLLGISAFVHGMTLNPMKTGIILGWELVIMGLIALVISRLAHIRVPLMSYLTLPLLPVYYAWDSIRLRVKGSSEETAAVVSRQQSENQSEKARPRRHTKPRRRIRRQPSR